MRVPDFIYKVVLDETPPRKMIAFIAPNRDAKKKPWQLAVTVDDGIFRFIDFSICDCIVALKHWRIAMPRQRHTRLGVMEKDEQERLESGWDFRKWF